MPTECSAKPLEFAPVAARRPELERVLDELETGDVLVVTKLDRLERSTRDLLNTLAAIGAANATSRSLHMPGLTPLRRSGG